MSQKNITVVATFQARPGKETELRAALLGLLAPTRQENGCLNYDLHVAADDPAKFLFHETWTSKAALDTHLQTPHIQTLLPRIGELCPEPPAIVIYDRLG
jgi:quinol monooxygenase YgiN